MVVGYMCLDQESYVRLHITSRLCLFDKSGSLDFRVTVLDVNVVGLL